MKIVEHGWEHFVDNLENWVDDWKNYWHNESGLHDLTVSGHYYFGSMRNSGVSSLDCTLVCKDYCSALKRPHSSFWKVLLSLKYRTLLKHMIHDLTVSTTLSWKLVWADLIDWTWFLSF